MILSFLVILGSVSTLDICVLKHYKSKVSDKCFASILEKVFTDIPELYVQFYQKEAMLQYILGASVKQELDIWQT